MSSASDKARFYLEQSVPELKEFERKKIFTADEIASIARKRSDFEHKINARGSSPSDYARYAEFEVNVDALKRRRVRRMGIKAPTHSGPRRIFFVLDRGTRKFPGDVGLWRQNIDFARTQKAFKKLSQILTDVLRLHPSNSGLWIYAAQHAMEEHGDMTEARSYMQRGLRFCKSSPHIWLEYARLELLYISKIAERRKVLGIGGEGVAHHQSLMDNTNADVIPLPVLTTDDVAPRAAGHDDIDEVALRNLDSTPAMSGAIPKAIFDAAVSHFKNDPAIAKEFFDLTCDFEVLSCRQTLLEHMDASMMMNTKDSAKAQACHIRLPMVGMRTSSPEFPAALKVSLGRLKIGLNQTSETQKLVGEVDGWLNSLLADQSMDEALRKVLQSTRISLGRTDE